MRIRSMDDNITFEQDFRYRFNKNWALRNILVNYFVYWKGGKNNPEKDVKKLHDFIRANGVFKGDQYPGIGRMLMIEDIFEEATNISKENDNACPWLIPTKYADFFEKVVNEEYGLDVELVKKPDHYTVAEFMWKVYNNLDRQHEQPKRQYGSAHMLEVAKQQFEKYFPKGLEVSQESSIYGDYLLVKGDGYCWPLFFISGSRVINKPEELFYVHLAFEVSDPSTEFPTICGTYFGDKIKEFAQKGRGRDRIQLLQLSSLFKFFKWVDGKKQDGIPPEKIAQYLHVIPEQSEVPIPVGRAILEMQKRI